MKKATIAWCALAVLIVGSLPAHGARPRTEAQPYDSPMGVSITDVAAAHLASEQTAYVTFTPAKGDRFVTLKIEDASGQTARGHIHMDMDHDGELDVVDDFCGTSPKLRVMPGHEIEVGVLGGTCPDGTPAFATNGEVVASFAR